MYHGTSSYRYEKVSCITDINDVHISGIKSVLCYPFGTFDLIETDDFVSITMHPSVHDPMLTISTKKTFLQEFLQTMQQTNRNFEKILKTLFLCTTCIVLFITGIGLLWHTIMSLKGLTICARVIVMHTNTVVNDTITMQSITGNISLRGYNDNIIIIIIHMLMPQYPMQFSGHTRNSWSAQLCVSEWWFT